MTTAGEAALRRMLAVFDLLIDAVDEDDLVPALLPPLLAAMPGDSIVWAPHPAPAGRVCLPRDLVSPDTAAAFVRGAGDDPLVAHTVAGSGTPARRSDLQSRAETRAMPVYGEVYRPLGAEHQLAMAFPAGYAGGAPAWDTPWNVWRRRVRPPRPWCLRCATGSPGGRPPCWRCSATG
jgi:hypothetical protein